MQGPTVNTPTLPGSTHVTRLVATCLVAVWAVVGYRLDRPFALGRVLVRSGNLEGQFGGLQALHVLHSQPARATPSLKKK